MTPIEDGRHHLQRSEFEALRAENARLTKELERARYMVGLLDGNCDNGTCRACPACFDVVAARVQELEGALKELLAVSPKHPECEPAGPWCAIFRARAALESGTGPIDPIGPIEKPIEPAPKTFTVEDIRKAACIAYNAGYSRNRGFGLVEDDIRRALGLGEP